MNANLVSIHSLAENDYVFGKYINFKKLGFLSTTKCTIFKEISSSHSAPSDDGNSIIWIGFIDQFSEQLPFHFGWTDNSTFDYVNYGPGYPVADINYKCGFMWTDYTNNVYNRHWGNTPCDGTSFRAFVCKKPAVH